MTNDPFAGLHGPRRSAPSGGADRAVSAGRRRLVRRRAAGTAAGVSVAVVAGAAIVQTRPGGTSGLTPAGHPAASASFAKADDAPPTALPTPSLPAVPTLLPTPASPPPTEEPTASPAPSASESAAPADRTFVGTSPHEVTAGTRNDPTACTNVPEQAEFTAQTGWCTTLAGPHTVKPGKPVDLAVMLCRSAGAAAKTVTFDSAYEVSVNVASYDDAGEVEEWAWAQPDDFAADRHTVAFKPGDCRTWTTQWAGQGNDGYALAEGSYQVNGYPWGFDWVSEDGDDAMGPAPVFYTVEVAS